MKKILIIIVAIILILSLLSLKDEALNDEVRAFLERIEETQGSEAYLFLVGILAGPAEDPIEAGRKQLAWYSVLLNRDNNMELDLSFHYPVENKLPLPEGELFCSLRYDDCLKTLFTREFDINALEQEHRVLLDRVRRLHAFEEYHTQTRPTLNEPSPPYDYVLNGVRINVLRAITVYKEGRPQEAVSLLLKNAREIRGFLALQDSFLGKMIYASLLSDILDITSVILTDGGEPIYVKQIPSLSSSPMHFDIVAARDLKGMYYTVVDVDRHFKSKKTGFEYPKVFKRIFYKPNMTINAVMPIYTRLDRQLAMTPEELAIEIENAEPLELSTSWIRNYAGNEMVKIPPPDYEKYVAIFTDLETKISLFNEMYHYRVQEDKVMNPYYHGEYSYREGRAVCFRGPVEAHKEMRCLRTGI